ncbi:MAG TPA: hypothetical protein VHM30_06405 [Gemmatimonadaceae bacterium]|nr:hypothetical protein [Gemmatimonadaceae bacterium]
MSPRVRHGVVLLEAVVGLLVVGLVAAAAVELAAADLRAARREPALLTASTLAEERLAAIRLLGEAQLPRIPDSLARGRFPAPFGGYRWRSTVTRARDEALYDVRVEVSWSEGSFTLLSRRPAIAAEAER